MNDFDIESPADETEVEMLLDTCFAPGRMALSSYRLRDGVPRVRDLCLLVRDDYGSIAGSIRYWPIRIGTHEGKGWPALLLGPVAVHPIWQGAGIGGALILESLSRARALGWQRVVLVGDEPYYRRFGFTRELAKQLDYPPPTNPNRLLARELVPGSMAGVSGMVHKWVD